MTRATSINLAEAGVEPERLWITEHSIADPISVAGCVDAVANVAHHENLRGGGVADAIWRAAGPQLRNDPALLSPCRPCEIRMTPGYRLAAKWILHSVSPRWMGGARDETAQLARCYRNLLAFAANRGLRSLAVLVIGTGGAGFEFVLAARIALVEAKQFLESHPAFDSILFAIPDDRGYTLTLLAGEVCGEYNGRRWDEG